MIVHNFYGSANPSGENEVVLLEKALLESREHHVTMFSRHSDSLITQGSVGALKAAIVTPWNIKSARSLAVALDKYKPDVVHVHNTFPILSPAIFSAARSYPRVMTLHNYRLFCPAAIPLRNGRPCTICIDRRSVLSSVAYGCYRESRIATVPLALNVSIHRGIKTWDRHVDRFIALTKFQKDLMVRGGLPEQKIRVKPNFFPGTPSVVEFGLRSQSVVYAGRLSIEKGVVDLIDAWKAWGDEAPQLKILGDGPLRAELQERAEGSRSIEFRGLVPAQVATEEIGRSRMLIVPSKWFEGFPMVLREAFALGTPVAVAQVGALPDIVKDACGVTFRSSDSADLLREIRQVWGSEQRLMEMSMRSRQLYESLYTEDINYRALLSIYEEAILSKRRG